MEQQDKGKHKKTTFDAAKVLVLMPQTQATAATLAGFGRGFEAHLAGRGARSVSAWTHCRRVTSGFELGRGLAYRGVDFRSNLA